MSGFVVALLLTVVIESAVLYLLKVREKGDYLLLTLVNVVTNIPANIFYQLNLYYNFINRWLRLALIETAVVLVEWKYINDYMKSDVRPLLTAVMVNVASFLGGILWNMLF